MSLRSPKAHGHVTRASVCDFFQEKCRTPSPQKQFCLEIYRKNARSIFRGRHFVWKLTRKNAHGHVTKAILCGNLQGKCRTPFAGSTFGMEIYKKTHGHVTRAILCGNSQEKCWNPVPTSIKHRAFYCDRKNPSKRPRCLGTYVKKNFSA